MLAQANGHPRAASGPVAAPVLEARGVSRTYEGGVKALRGVDLRVEAGEFVAIFGPSGSGKSTLLHVLGTLDGVDGGEVRIEGRAVGELREVELALLRRRRLGFVLQFFNLLPTMTALENAAFPLLLDGVPDALDRAARALDRVDMAPRADHVPARLSGGEQQRVAIARALVTNPAAVLADEPTGNLDDATTKRVLSLLRAAADDGETIVMVTHDPQVAGYADRVVRLADGELVAEQVALAG